jgi:hypothetical protein
MINIDGLMISSIKQLKGNDKEIIYKYAAVNSEEHKMYLGIKKKVSESNR